MARQVERTVYDRTEGVEPDPVPDTAVVTHVCVADTSVERPARRLAERGFSLVAVGCLPLLLWLAYTPQRFYQLSGADPFIYTGYAASMRDLIDRFGYTYYAVRFGLIVPSNMAGEVFGAVGGYFGLRWLLSSAVAIALFALCGRRYCWELGLLAALLALLNPIYVHAVMTMYSTTVGVPCIAIACALLLMPGAQKSKILSRLGAGGLLGIAVSANIFTLLPILALLAVWFGARYLHSRPTALGEVTLVTAAAMSVFAVGALVYWYQFGDPDILSPSIEAARRYDASTVVGTESDLRWLGFRPEIWLPLFGSGSLTLTFAALRMRPRWYEIAACGMPAAMWLSYAFHQFVLNGYTLETYYYTSYMWGPTVIAFVMAIGKLANCVRRPRVMLWICIAALLLVPVAWTHAMRGLAVWSLNGVVPIATLTVVCLFVSRYWRHAVWVVAGLIVLSPLVIALGTPHSVPLAPGQIFRQDPHYEEALFQDDNSTFDLYVVATEFARAVPRDERQPGTMVFWYNDEDYVLGLVQWTYLWAYSTLQSSSSPPFPELDDAERDRLEARTPRFIVVMGTDDASVDSAEAVLDPLAIERVGRRRLHFERGQFHFAVGISEYIPVTCDVEAQVEPIIWHLLERCPST